MGPKMLKSLGIGVIELGHVELRHFGEADEQVGSDKGKVEIIFEYELVWSTEIASAKYVVKVVRELRGVCQAMGREVTGSIIRGSVGPGTVKDLKEDVDWLILALFS
jgi:hypothetical protein